MMDLITFNELSGIAGELHDAVAELHSIWNDEQYSYFSEHYAESLIRDLQDTKDRVDEYILRISNAQMKFEGL